MLVDSADILLTYLIISLHDRCCKIRLLEYFCFIACLLFIKARFGRMRPGRCIGGAFNECIGYFCGFQIIQDPLLYWATVIVLYCIVDSGQSRIFYISINVIRYA